jgi:PAS domain S-box-containing protein
MKTCMNDRTPQKYPSWTEAERLAALEWYAIVDTPTEAEFEDLVHLASLVCGTPIAVINLIAAGKQWFKAERGLGTRETPLDVSICARVLLQPGLTVVPDLVLDDRFGSNPLVSGEPYLRFYAGALLETPDGLPLGTLCVLDHQPRPEGLTPEQAFTLQALARQAMAQIELRRALREERAAREREVAKENEHGGALRRSEALKSAILEASLDSIITIDQDSRIVEWNPAAERTFGHPAIAAIGQDLAQLIIPPEYRERHYKGMAHYLATGQGPVLRRRVELEALRVDGSRFPVELAISPIDVSGRPHFTAYLRDISERKRTEAALRENEQRLRSTYEHAFAGIAEVDAKGRYLRVNEQFSFITGFSREELLARTIADLTHPEDLNADWDQFRRQMAGEIEAYTVEKRYIHKDGHEVWIELSASRVDDEAGRPLYGVRVARDITERKQAEAANARLASIVTFSSDGILSISPEGRILTWNKGAEALFGYPEEEAVGAPITLIVPQDHLTERENHKGIMDLAVAEGNARLDTVRRRKDGTLVDVSVSAARMTDDHGRVLGVSAIYRDITDRRRWERQQQLLINELNHRVKNTLATVQSVATQSLRNAGDAEEARLAIGSRLVALARAHDVLTRENWEAADLREIISEAIAPYRQHGENRSRCEGPRVRLSPRMALPLAMALQELVTNAVKYGALSNATGTISISWTIDTTQAPERLKLRWEESGGPTVAPPSRRGFGSRLLERSLAQELDGEVHIAFAPTGLVCSMDVPLQ